MAFFKRGMMFLGGGLKYLSFSPLFGEDVQFNSYFSDGLIPPTSFVRVVFELVTPLNSPGKTPHKLQKKHDLGSRGFFC